MKEIKRIIDNHIYILKLIRKGSGWFPLFLIFFSVLRGFNTFFMTTWIYQYVINALQKGEKLTKIAVTAGVVLPSWAATVQAQMALSAAINVSGSGSYPA